MTLSPCGSSSEAVVLEEGKVSEGRLCREREGVWEEMGMELFVEAGLSVETGARQGVWVGEGVGVWDL